MLYFYPVRIFIFQINPNALSKQKFNNIVQHYFKIPAVDRRKLEQLAVEYPYSQALHTLIAKAHHDAGTDKAKETLQYAAMYATDRAVLKEIIFSKKEKTSTNQNHTDGKEEDLMSDLALLRKNRAAYEKLIEEEKPEVSKKPVRKTVASPTKTTKKVSAKKETPAKAPATRRRKSAPEADTAKTTTTKVTKATESSAKPANKKAEPKTSAKKAASATPAKKSTPPKAPKKPAARKSPVKTSAAANKKKTPVENRGTKKNASDKKNSGKKSSEDDPDHLIEKFIKKQPSLINRPVAFSPNQEDLSVDSTRYNEDLISENLALIMLNQGKKSKALEIYKKLIWKFPQKKAYFAARIEELTNQG